jgi:hypothetical protein
MLLFKQSHANLIMSGKKWATRRLWKKRRVRLGAIHKAKTKMLSTDYFAKLKILRCYRQRLGDMTQADVIAEGYKSLEDYKHALVQIHKRKKFCWNDDMVVYVVEFKVVE